jgi:UDP-N-acetylmuramate-alanine ligase
MLGAGGAGVSGAALLLRARGVDVSGHDRADSAFAEALRANGVPVTLGDAREAELADDVELVVRSAACGGHLF